MAFLLDKDFKHLVRQEIRQILIQNDKYSQDEAESAAIEIVKGYLRGTYDVDLIFPDIPLFVTDEQYNIDDYVYDPTDRIYKALVADPGNDLTNTDKWTPEDPRNKAIVRCIVDIALYDLHSHISPGSIPELRVKRYDDAMSWLNKVMKGQINPGLPVVEGQESGVHRLGSNDKVSERW